MEYKVGERIKIKSWKKMCDETNTDYNTDSIPVNEYFSKSMKHLCERTATISRIYSSGKIELENWSDTSGDVNWNFSTDMIEKLIVSKEDIEFADIITLRNGERYVYADDSLYGKDACYSCDRDGLYDWNDDLKYDYDGSDYREYDIIKIERNGYVIYERNEDTKAKEMTLSEICEELGYEVKIKKED